LSNPRFEIPGVKLLEAESCHDFFTVKHRFWTNATGLVWMLNWPQRRSKSEQVHGCLMSFLVGLEGI
jgi:hypothetical protein